LDGVDHPDCLRTTRRAHLHSHNQGGTNYTRIHPCPDLNSNPDSNEHPDTHFHPINAHTNG